MISGKDFDFKANQTFLFDTNIWMFLFCPIGNYKEKKQKDVSKFFERLLAAPQSQIIITSAIISEFANAFLRLDWKLWKDEEKVYGADFKRKYFKSERGKTTRKTIVHILRTKIFPITERYPDSFNSLDMEAIFKLYGSLDYNDSIFYFQCKNNRWFFVSDDTDFDEFADVVTIKP